MTDSNPGTHSIPSPVVAPPRWSRNVVRTEVSGHSCLVYAERPPSVPSLLLDARRWHGRTHFVQGDRRITFDAHERAVMRVVRRLQRAEIRARDRVLLFGTNQVEWVVAFWAIQCLGGVTVLGNAWWSEKERVRVWGSVPTMVSRVIDHEDFARYDTSSLVSVPMGGAVVSPELREKVRAAFPGVRGGAGTLYGLTEMERRPGCVGRPLPVVEVRIKDPDSNGVGEILARTPTAMSGYWGETAATIDVEGWVSTGDLGRLDEEGYLYVVGRSKDIIIRGGENIASVHVERALLTHPDVLEVVVVAPGTAPDESGRQGPAA
jgi:acyl-CoA synthetase (AMP-forming)/AMP-acid ligase II